MASKTEKTDVVNLFDMETLNETNFVEIRSGRQDGLFHPDLKDAKDVAKGYVATLRFLPNYLEDEQRWGLSSIEKMVHYVNLPDYPDLKGYYDGQKFGGEKVCALNSLYWRLKNSKVVSDNEKAALVSGSKKFYSYVLVIEDEQHPELVGKILVFPYGYKIKEKIEAEKNGNNTEEKPCNVFEPANGKDFRFIMKKVGQFPNYDSSNFKVSSSMKVWDEKGQKLMVVPVTFDEAKGINKITNASVQKKIIEFLLTRTTKLEDNAPKVWTSEEREKVLRISFLLTSKNEHDTSYSTSLKDTPKQENSDDEIIDGFFDQIGEDVD